MTRDILHYGIHFVVPVLIGWFIFKQKRGAIFILLAGIVIDIDHLLADPIFDPNRCSINYHPLHSYWAIACYIGLTVYKKTRLWGLALLIHILADLVDCYMLLKA